MDSRTRRNQAVSSPSAPVGPSPGRARPLVRVLITLTLLGGLAATAYGIWFWKQYNRPGMVHYRRGLDAATAGRALQAQQEWLEGVRQDPTFPRCYSELGNLYMAAQRPKTAAGYYDQAARLAPTSASLWFRLAYADLKAGELLAALSAAEQSARLRPNDANSVGIYGLILTKLGRHAQSVAQLRRAHQLDPADRDYLIELVASEMDGQDMTAAERDLAPFLQAHPQDPQACYLMAYLLNHTPHASQTLNVALDYALRAQAGAPGTASVYALLGQIYSALGRDDEAQRSYEAGAHLDQSNVSILQGLVNLYSRKGRKREAARAAETLQAVNARHLRMTHLEDQLRISRSNVAAGLELARLEEEDGHPDHALSYLSLLVHDNPPDPRPRKALAAFLQRNGPSDLAPQAPKQDFVP